MPVKFIPPPSWGCTDEWRTNDLLAEIYQCLGADIPEDQQCARETVSAIIRAFQESRKLEKASPKLADSRMVFSDLNRSGRTLLTKIRESLRHLDAGFGGATNEIGDNPTRRERDAQRDSLAKNWRFLATNIEKLLDDTKTYAANWEGTKRGNLNIETMQHGPAKQQLVKAVYDLFEKFRPNEATKSATGPFCKLCDGVYELATGETVSLHYHVRTVLTAIQKNN